MVNEKRLIDANALMEVYRKVDYNSPGAWSLRDILNFLEIAPTVDAVEVVHGKWIKEQLLGCEPFYLCSVCGKLHDQDYNFCNNCGAKMDGGNEE